MRRYATMLPSYHPFTTLPSYYPHQECGGINEALWHLASLTGKAEHLLTLTLPITLTLTLALTLNPLTC